MYIRRRIGRRRSFYTKHRKLILLSAGAAVCFAALLVVWAVTHTSHMITTETYREEAAPRPARTFQPAKYERVVYPYSVIPGGVFNRDELAASVRNDKVVSAHFADFRVGQARVVKLEATQYLHVSYRMKDKVYWTARKVRIPEGESVITDGDKIARTRCGNRVSATPQEPVAEEEPVIETFDVPVLARLDMPETGLELNEVPSIELPETSLELAQVPPIEPFVPIQRPRILPYYYRPLFVVRPAPPSVVPEPATWSLLGVGLAALFALRKFRKK